MKMVISSHSVMALLSALILATNYLASATDDGQLQDTCPAIPEDGHKKMVSVNGKFCKDPKTVTSGDFVCTGYRIISDPTNTISTRYNVDSCRSVNTMGVSANVVRLGPYGYFLEHEHPRGSELLIVEKGLIFAAFQTSTSNNNKVFYAFLRKGNSFVIPQGLPHIVMNVANKPAKAFVSFSSQNPGVVNLSQRGGLFPVNVDDLAKEFSLDMETIAMMKKNLAGLAT